MARSAWKKNTVILLIWLALWCGLDLFVHNSIMLAGPVETVRALISLLPTGEFWLSILRSAVRIFGGYLTGSAIGMLFAAAGYRFPLFDDFISPFVRVIRAVPVASFVILLLIWAGSRNLAFFICALVTFPILYLNTKSGLVSMDEKLLEMGRVYRFPYASRVRHLYLPHLLPHLQSAFALSLGMSWKSGVAAEVIGQPKGTVGNALYRAKVFLATPELFAWTAVIVALSWCMEKGLGLLISRIAEAVRKRRLAKDRTQTEALVSERKESCGQPAEESAADRGIQAPDETGGAVKEEGIFLTAENVGKAFDGKTVLSGVSLTLRNGGRLLLAGESGAGKTTLLRILAGLETPDQGEIRVPGIPEKERHPLHAGFAFQEERLIEGVSAVRNLCAITRRPDMEKARALLLMLLPASSIDQPVRELSGGMRRRVSIARALLSETPVLFFDEPFAGLDEENMQRALHCILANAAGRPLVLVTHELPEDPAWESFRKVTLS